MRKVVGITIKSILFFMIWLIGASIIPIPDVENPATWRLFAEFIPLMAICIDTVLFWLLEKRQIHLCLTRHLLKGIITGSIVGIVWLLMPIILMYLLHIMHFGENNDVPLLGIWFLATFLNVVMQELLVRGYLYQMLKQKCNITIATVVTTAIFTLLHGGAFEAGIIPIYNVLTMSLLMTILLEYTKSFWTPVMAHFIWNAVGALILNGVALADDYPHVFNTVFTGNDILSGRICKIEGSIFVLVVNILFMIIIFFRFHKKSFFGYAIAKRKYH